jgi:digeranylgeranylglycerophospholipid reductase
MRVIIIGAGIVGLYLAKELALKNIEVEVYDRKHDVTEGAGKASGILSITGLKASGLPYKGTALNTLDGALLYAGRQKLSIEAKEPKAYVIDRAKLALNAYDEAVKHGAKINLGTNIGKNELLALAHDSRNIIVGADGAVSTVASTFSFPHINRYVLTYKAVYENAHIDYNDKVELVFSNMTPGFFGWTVPYSKDVMEIGVGISANEKINSYDAFREFVRSNIISHHIAHAKKTSGYASMIPLETRRITVKGNVALVGDAAGQVKATTGGGIIFGTACAHTLGLVIDNHVNKNAPLNLYEKEWRKRYGRDLKLHSLAHAYYSSLSDRNFEMLFRLSRIFGVEGFLGKYGDMDSPGIIIRRFFLRR